MTPAGFETDGHVTRTLNGSDFEGVTFANGKSATIYAARKGFMVVEDLPDGHARIRKHTKSVRRLKNGTRVVPL